MQKRIFWKTYNNQSISLIALYKMEIFVSL